MKKFFLIIGFLSFTSFSFSQGENTLQLEEGASSPPANLLDYDWVAGYWKGEAFGGQVEEVWTHASAGSMMGSFKLIVDDKVSFYELMVISQEKETLLMKLKHFDGDLKGWEEKGDTVDFPLVKAEKDRLYFEGLTFERLGEKSMNVYVLIGMEKEVEEVKFTYTKE
ncbi:MAG: DUF6265 family protein [Bacteroidota bacterium]